MNRIECAWFVSMTLTVPLISIDWRVAFAQDGTPPDSPPAVLAFQGRDLYRAACAACHGKLGDGNGPAARGMKPLPRDFTSGVFKFRSTPTGALPTDEDLFRAISDGVPGTWMPAWAELLTEQERWAVIAYLKTLAPDFQSEFANEPALPLPNRPSVDATTAEGRFVYLALKCWDCHGLRGRGSGPSAGTLTDDWGRSIRAYDFTRGNYKNGAAPKDVYRTLRTGLDGTPMPAYEPQAVLYPGGSAVDLSKYAEALASDELAALRQYLAEEPDRADLNAMPEAERTALADRRLWSLVSYLGSLSRPRDFWYRLFVDDPNATSPVGAP